MSIDFSKNIVRADGAISTDLDGETVILEMESGSYIGLDEVGTNVWEIIEKPVTLNNLIDLILIDYDVEREDCTSDVKQFLTELFELGLVSLK